MLLSLGASADEASPLFIAEAKNNYAKLCGICHGISGNGKGHAGASLIPPPTDFTLPGLSAKLTQDKLWHAIKHGVPGTSMGNYTLHANSINTLFNGGSGIGPYSDDINDRSFTSPHPIASVTFQGDTTGSDEIISITNGQAKTVNFAIDGKTAVVTADSSNDKNNSVADLFGSMSYITLLVTGVLLIFGRWRLQN